MALQVKSFTDFLTSRASNLRPHRPTSSSPHSFSMHSHTNAKTNASEWQGLPAWRRSGVNENRNWGVKGPEEAAEFPLPVAHHKKNDENENENTCSSLAEWGALVLSTADPAQKVWLSHYAYKQWCNGKIPIGAAKPPEKPARLDKPELVSPKEIPSPKNSSLPHNAHILHNLAHIELNAIDLAWDTVVRFSTVSEILGSQFFSDFAHVADDESRHFSWCLQRLAELGFRYDASNLGLERCDNHLDVKNEKDRMISQSWKGCPVLSMHIAILIISIMNVENPPILISPRFMKGSLALLPWRKKIMSYNDGDNNCSFGFFHIGNIGKF